MRKIELLSPAGDLNKLKAAISYGADAVYIGGSKFGLRASSKNFDFEEIREGLEFAHTRGKKVYVTCNIIPHNDDLNGLEEYITELYNLGVDALIVSDAGVFMTAKKTCPNLELHISTQSGNTNYANAIFWHEMGAKRIVLARELSFDEIKEIREKIPSDMEIESFVHGAMCISYSGRCLMSSYMTHRDANRGECAHPCRWKYALVEENRPGEYFPIEEDERGTYFFNSKDLCMIEYIPELVKSGITSLKIEGRVKSEYYVATVTRAYRKALDSYIKDPANYVFNLEWLDELKKVSHRHFTTGFYNDKPDEKSQNYETGSYVREYDFVGVIEGYDCEKKIAYVQVRNKLQVGDEIEIMRPLKDNECVKISEIISQDGENIQAAPTPMQIVGIPMNKVDKGDFVRKKR